MGREKCHEDTIDEYYVRITQSLLHTRRDSLPSLAKMVGVFARLVGLVRESTTYEVVAVLNCRTIPNTGGRREFEVQVAWLPNTGWVPEPLMVPGPLYNAFVITKKRHTYWATCTIVARRRDGNFKVHKKREDLVVAGDVLKVMAGTWDGVGGKKGM
jgi:hypothetical protein